MGLHQGSALNPYLFTLILDELSSGLQEELPWCMIFADDIALIARSTEELNRRLEKWREALEDNGLCVSQDKIEYLRCDFDKQEIRQNGDEDIRIGERVLGPKVSFRYLGSVIHKSGGIDEDVTHRIQAGWMRWRAASGVMCDKRMPLKLKGKFYRVAIRPTMLYGSECWPMTKAQASRVEVAEIRMLRWSCGKTLSDRIPTGVFREPNLKWHAVASWTWDAHDDACGICRMAFDGCCPDCKLPGDDCPLIWGACNHAFHLHCILKWVNSQTPQAHCPYCRAEWQFKE
uniref:uncharacterized protein LOC122591919 n=1 Tax=Erigeron canadensis TaxID=72917 RepID=UPI001CB9A1DE|nr:uncharacterized protein LOC122591919 [Erigeron canadensis]